MKFQVRAGVTMTALAAGAAVASAVPNGYTIYWADEFNLGVGKQANSAFWGYDIGNSGWGNQELEDYTSAYANSHIVADAKATDGLAMQIQAIKTGSNSYTSARLITQGKVFPKYGFVESRLRMPYGQGIWPAFWQLGSNYPSVGWPACGEADIMENIGSVPTTNWGSLHATNYNASETYVLSGNQQYHNAYHLFQSSWTPNSYAFFVDDNPYHFETVNNLSNWPYNQGMFFIMNIAVGGDWPGAPNSTTVFPQTMLVDYVRVYHLTGVASNEIVSFFSSVNSKFVSAENGGSSPLDCNRTSASTWEQFLIVDLGSNHVALLSQANGKYVTVSSGSTPSLIANGSTVNTAATFQWTPNADGTVYFKSLANGKYVTVDSSTNPPSVLASASSPSATFGITCYSQAAAPHTPAVPQRVTAKAGADSAVIDWSPVTGATSYEVYCSSLPGGGGMAPIASVKSAGATISGLKPKTTYSFAVTALNAQGMSLRSSIVTATP